MQITLGELSSLLEKLDPDYNLEFGFSCPHSYRGMYDCVSFQPSQTNRVGHLLNEVKDALSGTYTGWKGGEFCYDLGTPVFFAYEGFCEDGAGCHEYSEVGELREYFFNLINKV